MQITFQFGPCDHSMYPQKYIQDKAWWYLFKINGQTVAGSPKYCHPSGWNDHIFTQTYTNYGDYANYYSIYLHTWCNTNSWHFLIKTKHGYLTSQVDHIKSLATLHPPHCVSIKFEEMLSCFLLNDFFVTLHY